MKTYRMKKIFTLFTLSLLMTVCGNSTILAAQSGEVLRGAVDQTWYAEEERTYYNDYPMKIWVVKVAPGGQNYEGYLYVKRVYPRSNTGRYHVLYAGTLSLASK